MHSPETSNSEEVKKDLGHIDTLDQKLKQAADHPESVDKVVSVFSKIDQSSAMKTLRKHWDARSPSMQWAIMHLSKGPMMLSPTGPIQALVKCGFLDYHGHRDESGKIDDEKVKSMGEFELKVLKYGVKFGKYIFPELAPLDPYMEPIMKVAGTQNDVLSQIRQKMRAERAPETISNGINHNIDDLLKRKIGKDEKSDKKPRLTN